MRLMRRHPHEEEAGATEAPAAEEARPASPPPPGPTTAERPAARRGEVLERVRTDDVVVTPWAWPDALVGLLGAAVALVGAIALIRAGLGSRLYSPETSVLGAQHTPLLGLIELGVGVVLMVLAAARLRAIAGLLGLAVAVAAVLGIVETAELSRELAIENWWALVLLGGGLLVALLSLVPRRGRVERVTRTTDLEHMPQA